MPIRDIRLERCRRYLRAQTKADTKAGLYVRKTVFHLVGDHELHPAANLFMACLAQFDRALVEGAPRHMIEATRRPAIEAFDDLVVQLRKEKHDRSRDRPSAVMRR